ncbi:TCR/Tet family MFS transporter [Lysobacter solisilvae (ex Woo and Kim 2020)]|uniref:TCR/Tet family MFS transporter n=1 Tax=Agrilutibacter terrestris TaxID=2865112 RepID=A0A7H0G1H1_9GAMM|nr:TCR/Tet family MFS transporter [Lysobacter terrestris]
MVPVTEPNHGARKAALIFIFVTVLIDILAFGLIIPVLPLLVKQFAGGSTISAAHWIGVFGVLFSAIQFVFAPVQGALSDRYGRRPVILLSCFGLGVDFIFMALANSMPWLLVGRVISAVFSASFTTANAYIADITAPEKRAQAFGMLGAAFGLGFIVGPVLGGWLSVIDLRFPFWGAAILALCNFIYGWFVLPESHPREHRSPTFDWRHANPLGSLKLLRSYPQIWGLAAVVFLLNLAHFVYPNIFVLFADYRYHWGPEAVGSVLAIVGVCGVIVQAVLVRHAVAAWGERRTLMVGLCAGIVGFTIYGWAPTGMLFLVGIPVMAFWGFSMPATQALVTKQVDRSVQGRVQGALSSLMSLAGILAPQFYTGIFAWFIGDHAPAQQPGAPFWAAGLLLVVALGMAWRFARAPQAVPQPA